MFFFLAILTTIVFILTGIGSLHAQEEVFCSIDENTDVRDETTLSWFFNLANIFVGSGLRHGGATLISIFFFAILLLCFGALIFVYFFDGWQLFCECPIDLGILL